MRARTTALCVTVLALVGLTAASLVAQAPSAKTASQFYAEYRAAFQKAQKIEDLYPFVTAEQRQQMDGTSAELRVQMFGMLKTLNTVTDLKVIKEERTATGATLTAEAIDSDKQKTKGTVTVVREDGAWKIGKETWSN